MEKLSRTVPVTVNLTEAEWSVLEELAKGDAKRPRVWARDQILKGLDQGPRVDEKSEVLGEVLSQVRALGSLVGELVVELMLYMHGGDTGQAFAKANELFERARGNQKSDGRT